MNVSGLPVSISAVGRALRPAGDDPYAGSPRRQQRNEPGLELDADDHRPRQRGQSQGAGARFQSAAELKAGYTRNAALLNRMIDQMGGGDIPSSIGSYIDIRI